MKKKKKKKQTYCDIYCTKCNQGQFEAPFLKKLIFKIMKNRKVVLNHLFLNVDEFEVCQISTSDSKTASNLNAVLNSPFTPRLPMQWKRDF